MAAAQVCSGDVATVQDVNVSAVQDILVSTFHQRIHGPPGGPLPGPAPAYYNVSGAGKASLNGQYKATGNQVNDRPEYCGGTPACLYSNDGVWRIAILGQELFYVANAVSALPPLTGWHCANGTAPAPILTAVCQQPHVEGSAGD